ncbi:MAG: PilZ domain-containing protein [Pseudomonadales bacterium]|nr:PilZ domain-containing protein [Pseudomonadales bacterium]
MEKERRRHRRYQRSDLELDVARPGIKGILSINPTSECLDFSLAGLQFSSPKQFSKGEKLILDLRVYEIHIRELKAQVITSKARAKGLFCTGVRFCFEEKSMQRPEISHALLQIEDKLRSAQEYPFTA